MNAFFKFSTVALVSSLALDACGGSGTTPVPSLFRNGGSGSGAGNGAGGSTTSAKTTHISGTVLIPAAPAKAATTIRKPQYISSGTQSLTFAQGGSTTIVPLAANSPNCTAVAGGRSCAFTAPAIPGTNVSYTVSTFASVDGSGIPLSTATMTATVTAGTNNTLTLTLSPVLGSLSVASAASFITGTAGTGTVTVTALDASGATIATGVAGLVDASGNAVTVLLADADTSGFTTLSPTTLTSSTSILSYNGGGTPTSETITASASSTANPSVATATGAFVFRGESLYVLDVGGSRVLEYGLASDGTLATNATPKRVINISSSPMPSSAICTSSSSNTFASSLAAIAVDPAGNVFVNTACVSSDFKTGFMFEYAPNAGSTGTGTTAPTAIYAVPPITEDIALDQSASTASGDVFYAHTLPGLATNLAAGSNANFTFGLYQFTLAPSAAATATVQPVTSVFVATNGYPGHVDQPTQQTPNAPAISDSVVQTYSLDNTFSYVTPGNQVPAEFNAPVLAAAGSVYSAWSVAAGNPMGPTAQPPNVPGAFAANPDAGMLYRFDNGAAFPNYLQSLTAVGPAAAIVGSNVAMGVGTLSNSTIVDGMATGSGRLDVLLDGSNSASTDPNSPGYAALNACQTPPTLSGTTAVNVFCADGNSHETLLSYNLSALGAANTADGSLGFDNIAPVFAIGLGPTATHGPAPFYADSGLGNPIADYGSYIFAANPLGALGTAPELDVYRASGLTGPSNVAPATVTIPASVVPGSVAVGLGGAFAETPPAITSRRTVLWPNYKRAILTRNVSRRHS